MTEKNSLPDSQLIDEAPSLMRAQRAYTDSLDKKFHSGLYETPKESTFWIKTVHTPLSSQTASTPPQSND